MCIRDSRSSTSGSSPVGVQVGRHPHLLACRLEGQRRRGGTLSPGPDPYHRPVASSAPGSQLVGWRCEGGS
eukprot:6257885-Alexandrium_andersonii.AAC.1